MPALSPTMSEGKLSKWLVKEGDKIKAGDLLAEIETDKAIMEFESSEDGTLKKILVNEGVENIKVNEPIALLETSNSLVDENIPQKIVNENKEISKKEPENNNSLLLGMGDILQKNPEHKKKEVLNKDRIKISPLAKKIAIQHNINFRDLEGTGPSGRIIKADIEKLIKIGNAPTPLKDHKPLVNDENDYTLLNPMRKTIAERLSKSKREIPHFYLRKKVYVDKLLLARKLLNKKVIIIKDANITDCILKSEYVIHDYCTTSLEGLLYKKIPICYKVTKNDLYLNQLPYYFSNSFEKKEDILSFINSKKKKFLKKKNINLYIDNFSQKKSCKKISKIMDKFKINDNRDTFEKFKSNSILKLYELKFLFSNDKYVDSKTKFISISEINEFLTHLKIKKFNLKKIISNLYLLSK